MKGLQQHELYVVAQKERVSKLESTVISWIDRLAPEQRLLVAIPQVLGDWSESTPIIVGPNMQDEFRGWLNECAEYIQGPTYNLPALTAGFICAVIDDEFDPRDQQPPEGASVELLGTLASLGTFLDSLETKAA